MEDWEVRTRLDSVELRLAALEVLQGETVKALRNRNEELEAQVAELSHALYVTIQSRDCILEQLAGGT